MTFPCAVDVELDGFLAVAGELAQLLYDGARRVLLDVADEVDVPEGVRFSLRTEVLDGIDQIGEQTFVEVAHIRHLPAFTPRAG